MNIFQQPLIEAQRGDDLRLLADDHLVLQTETADARSSRIRFDAEKHTRLQRNDRVRREIRDPWGFPGVDPGAVAPREVIGIRVSLAVVQVFADVPVRLPYLRLGAGIEQGVVTLLMQFDLLFGRPDIPADIRAGEVSQYPLKQAPISTITMSPSRIARSEVNLR